MSRRVHENPAITALALLACGRCRHRFARARAADIVAGDVTAALGPDFFMDDAATGGGDNNATVFTRNFSGFWTDGATVTLKGLGWASGNAGTTSTSVTATFSEPGPDGTHGTGDDIIVGTVTDNLVYTGTSEYVWDFDSDIVFVSTGDSLRVRIVSGASIRRKTHPPAPPSQSDVKLSLAGTAVGGTPPPVTNTATGSGNWDTIDWDTGTGSVTGDLQDDDTVLIGRYRSVTYPRHSRQRNHRHPQSRSAYLTRFTLSF